MTDPISFDDKKRKVAKKVKEILDEAEPKPAKKPRKKVTRIKGNVISINGEGNSLGQVAGGDIHNNINKKEIIRPKIIRGPEHISSSCALKIRSRIDTLVELGVASGKGDASKLYKMWYAKIRKHFNVSTYLEIPACHEESAIKWLQNQKALLRPTIRRSSNANWRKDHYTGIWSKANELGMSKADVYFLVKERLGKTVFSLRNLGEQDLTRLYQIMFKLPRSS